MDYLDELDDSAVQALVELGGDINNQVTRSNTAPSLTRQLRFRRVQPVYLLRLVESPFSTPRDVANILELSRVPQLRIGINEGTCSLTSFCCLGPTEIEALDSWTAKNCPGKKFTKIRLGIAHKDPFELPVLGRDPTLPQYRPSISGSREDVHLSDKYPVRYFFYGTLASPSLLSKLLEIPLSEIPRLEAALLCDGRIRTWAGKYKALVDSPGDTVEGMVYSVYSSDEEDALRTYEGDSYEVVSARVILKGEETRALTFRFSGFEDELSGYKA